MKTAAFAKKKLDDLTIEDEASFRHVGLYADLAKWVRKSGTVFRVLPDDDMAAWPRALFLNLTFWGATEGGDVLVDDTIPADVVAHVAWHGLAAKALAPKEGPMSFDALFLGEAIASAFDVYLVGRLLGHAPDSSFLATQVEAMSEAAEDAGLDEDGFEKLLEDVADDPERAFASLRELLVDATMSLYADDTAEKALHTLTRLGEHRFGALLHRYELSNWLLYARAYGNTAPSPVVVEVERALRAAPDPLAWLTDHWVLPALK